MPNEFYPEHLGKLYIEEDDWQTDIHVYRERWMDHLAYIGGINLFWIFFVQCCLSCCVKNQFNASLRNELNPQVVKQSDAQLNSNPISLIRRTFFSQVPVLNNSTAEEVALDEEIQHHLSYQNLFELSRLVEQQKD